MYWEIELEVDVAESKKTSRRHIPTSCVASSIGSLGQAIAENTTSGPVKPEVGFLDAVSAPKRSSLPGNVALERRRARWAVPTCARRESDHAECGGLQKQYITSPFSLLVGT